MTHIEWNLGTENVYETGVDRGVLYPANGNGVAWNGLVSVDKKNKQTQATDLYYEGSKFDMLDLEEDRITTVSAYTYPEVLDELLGYHIDTEGFVYGDQPRGYFSMSYRTMVRQGPDYKIHVLINQKGTPSGEGYTTIGSSVSPTTFSWELSGVPIRFRKKSVTYMCFDSRKVRPTTFKNIENTLYGTNLRDANFVEFLEYIY